jgi:serine/threonine protein kinase
MEDAFFENSRIDALAMERLTASPSVIAIYGFCSMTVVQEFAGFQLSPIIAKATPSERLDLAVQIARGIRDIHSIGNSSQPSLVHNDVNLANIIVTDDGRPLLNDFNIAVMMMANKTTGQACPYYARYPNPQWRSPEEQVDSEEESKLNPPLVNEKIDMYAMGNVLYRMVAGGSPWKKKGADKLMLDEKILVARLKRYNGTLPGVPESVRHSKDPSTAALYQAMKLCYRFDAQARPSAQELVVFLEAARGRAPTTN